MQQLGAALRFGGRLPDRLRELVICLIAGQRDAAYEWYAHSRAARRAGVTEDELADLRAGLVPALTDPTEAAVLDLVDATVNAPRVPREVWECARSRAGEAVTVEALLVAGYYVTLSLVLAAADVPAPGDH